MKRNQEEKREDIMFNTLEAKLRSLPEVEVPKSLKAKLFAKIPDSKVECTRKYQVQSRTRVWGLGIAAAAIVILAVIFSPNYDPSVPSREVIADLNDRTTRYLLADQNNTINKDSNYVDFNGQ